MENNDEVLNVMAEFATSYGDEPPKYMEHTNWEYGAYGTPSELHADLELARAQVGAANGWESIFDCGFDEGACCGEAGGFGGGISENCEGEAEAFGGLQNFNDCGGFDNYGGFGAALDSENSFGSSGFDIGFDSSSSWDSGGMFSSSNDFSSTWDSNPWDSFKK